MCSHTQTLGRLHTSGRRSLAKQLNTVKPMYFLFPQTHNVAFTFHEEVVGWWWGGWGVDLYKISLIKKKMYVFFFNTLHSFIAIYKHGNWLTGMPRQ